MGGRLGVLPYKNNLVLLLRQCQGKWKLKSDCSPEHMLERIWSIYVFLPCLLLLSFATSSWWVPLNVCCLMLVCLSLLFCWNTWMLSFAFLSCGLFVLVALSLSLSLSVCLYWCLFLFLSCLLCLPVCLPLQSGPCGTHFWGASETQGTFGTVMRKIGNGAGNKEQIVWSRVMCFVTFANCRLWTSWQLRHTCGRATTTRPPSVSKFVAMSLSRLLLWSWAK